MNLFNTVTDYIAKAIKPIMTFVGVDGAEGSGSSSASQTNEKPNSVFTEAEGKTEATSGDMYQKSEEAGSNPKSQEQSLSEQIGQLKATVKVQCQRNGIEFEEALKFMGLSLAGFNQLTEDNQKNILGIIGTAIQEAEKVQKDGRMSRQVDARKVTLQSMAMINNAIAEGTFESVEEYRNALKNLPSKELEQKLINGINNFNKDELIQYLSEYESGIENQYQAALAQIQGLPKEQYERRKARIDRRYNTLREACFNRILYSADSEQAAYCVTLGKQHQVPKFAKRVIDTRSNKAESMRTADFMDMEFNMDIAKIFHGRGDAFQPCSMQELNTIETQYSSKEGVYNRQRQYVEFRNKCEENGSYPEYFGKEMFTATSIGIGVGATVNENMTTEERAEFLNTWDYDAQQYDDYNTVIQGYEEGIQQYINEHQNEQPGIENDINTVIAKRSEVSNYNQQANSTSNNNNENDAPASNNQTNSRNDEASSSHSSSSSGSSESGSRTTSCGGYSTVYMCTNPNTTGQDAGTSLVNPLNTGHTNYELSSSTAKTIDLKSASPQQVERYLASGVVSFAQVLKQLDEDKAFKIIFSNNNLLSQHIDEAKKYIINQKDPQKLIELPLTSVGLVLITKYNRVSNREALITKLEKKATSDQKCLLEHQIY